MHSPLPQLLIQEVKTSVARRGYPNGITEFGSRVWQVQGVPSSLQMVVTCVQLRDMWLTVIKGHGACLSSCLLGWGSQKPH